MNPGILACNPYALSKSNAGEILRTARAIDAVDQIPLPVRWAIPIVAVLGVVGLVGSKLAAQ